LQVQEQSRRIRDVLNVAHAVRHGDETPLVLDHVSRAGRCCVSLL
jgi:hypothetical protein